MGGLLLRGRRKGGEEESTYKGRDGKTEEENPPKSR